MVLQVLGGEILRKKFLLVFVSSLRGSILKTKYFCSLVSLIKSVFQEINLQDYSKELLCKNTLDFLEM